MTRKSKTFAGAGRGFRLREVAALLIRLVPAAFIAIMFAMVGILHVTSRVAVVSTAYKLSKAQQQNQELTRDHDRLKLELATLKSPARLEHTARESLGMAPPPPGMVLTIDHSGGHSGAHSGARPGPARAARSAPRPDEAAGAPMRFAERGEIP